MFLVSLEEITYQFLSHMIDIKRGNLIDKLATKDVLSPDERQALKKQKKTDSKLNTLLLMLRQKSAVDFESFLAALSETGQQLVADVVHLALHTVAQTGQNPLQSVYGKSSFTFVCQMTIDTISWPEAVMLGIEFTVEKLLQYIGLG